jgi:tight adherence protein B
MTLFVGFIFGIGVVLALSPFFWPNGFGSGILGSSVFAPFRESLIQAGLTRVGVPTLMFVSLLLGVGAAALVFTFIPVVVVAIAAGAMALLAPFLIIHFRARAHRRATRMIWPDAVDHLVSAVRSGLALPDSVVLLAHTGPMIIRPAFAAFEREYRASGNFSDALDRLKTQLADPVADRIIETLRMSREVGGNELTTVLRNLAAYLRQDAAIRQEVEARQSWIVNAARLGVAAPWVVLALLSTRPEGVAAYNSPMGVGIIAVGIVLSVIAYRLMLRIGRLPEEQRWFA